MLEVGGPGCALVREDVRVVEMKIVDDVGVVERLDEEEFVVGRPVGAGDDDGVGGSAFANRGSEAGLHAFPAVAIAKFGLVENLEKNEIGVCVGVVVGEGAPEIFELL